MKTPSRFPLFAAIVAACIGATAAPALANPDADHMSATSVEASVLFGRTKSSLTSFFDSTGQRPTDITRIGNDSFDALTVDAYPNPTGIATLPPGDYASDYGREWKFDSGLSASALSSFVSGGWRLLSLHPYRTALAGIQFSYVAVKNTGPATKTWWYYTDKTPSEITALLTANGARLVDLEKRADDGKYAAVMIANTGTDAAQSFFSVGQSEAQVRALLSTKNARPLLINQTAADTYDVVTVPEGRQVWAWLTGLTQAQVDTASSAPGARIYGLSRFRAAFQTDKFSALVMNPGGPPPAGTESRRLYDYFQQHFAGADFGFEVKEVGGPVIAAYQPKEVFEPASAVKVLPLTYAMQRVAAGAINLDTPGTITLSDSPACVAGDKVSLRTALTRMVRESHNPSTHGIINKFGNGRINALASDNGMPDTRIRGCGLASGRSDWTPDQIASFYEKMDNGTFLSDTAPDYWETTMWDLMSKGPWYYADVLKALAPEGSTNYNYINSGTDFRWKGGSIGGCLPAPAPCDSKQYVERAFGGRIVIPGRNEKGDPTERHYVVNFAIDSYTLNCAGRGNDSDDVYFARCPQARFTDGKGQDDTVAELLREPFKTAVQSMNNMPTTCGGQAATILGTVGNDVLTGTPQRDVIVAGPGDDTVAGRQGDDLVCGGDGTDLIKGGTGNDDLRGGFGDDDLRGAEGQDRCDGGVGIDAAATCEQVTAVP